MAKNEFLPFGIAEGANVLSNQEYERLAARFNGFISGVAKSKELNTVWRQSSVISSAIAQFIVDSDNKDLLDNGDVAGIKNRLVAAIKQIISGVGYVTTAAMNLELNKKIDKANISGVKGNDNDKVPSLNLFTTEIGKLASLSYSYSKVESDNRFQPKGNYQPSGDYATNTALNNGLALKFDKTGGNIAGVVIAAGKIETQGGEILVRKQGTTSSVVLHISNSNIPQLRAKNGSSDWTDHELPDKSGKLMQVGDFGFGGRGGDVTLIETELNSFMLRPSTASQVFRNKTATSMSTAYSAIAYFGTADTFTAISADYEGKGVIITGGSYLNSFKYNLLTDKNTIIDRNGCIRISNSNELSDYPVGSPIPWPQVSAPTGFLVCNGQSFNKASYPLLAKAYPSGVLPDLRAEFIRGLDAGRNVDVGRTALSNQVHAYPEHSHNLELFRASGNGSHNTHALRTLGSDLSSGTYTTTPAGAGTETRPRNIAFLYIVRAA